MPNINQVVINRQRISDTKLPSSTHLCCLLVTLLVAASVRLRMQLGMR